MDALKLEIKQLIIEALMIEEMEPAEIGDTMVLFGWPPAPHGSWTE